MQDILTMITSNEITLVSSIIYIVIALLVSAIGGAIGGIIIGGKHLGNDLAAMMGSFYGPIAAVPGALIALIVLALI